MGDDCVLMVESSTSPLGTTIIETSNGIRVVQAKELDVEAEKEIEMELAHVHVAWNKDGGDHVNSKGEISNVECRICHEEEQEVCTMESPCSCSGSLKYAHRRCVQRWCNEKGDTICEICLEAFKPGYTSPPKLFHQGRAPINFRDNWEASRQMAMYLPRAGGGYSDGDYDEYGSPSNKSLLLCRIIAVIFVTVLVLRHILPVILNEEELSLEDFSLFAMRIAAIFFPLYVIIQMLSFLYIRRRRRQENRELPVAAFGGDSSPRSWWELQLMHII